MVEEKDDKAVMYVNSETGFGSLRIVKGLEHLMYISDSDMVEGHRYPTIKHKIYIKIYLKVAVNILDLKVNCWIYSRA